METNTVDNYNITGVCKDCGAGTLNGRTNPQFDLVDDAVVCNSCGGSHVDVVSITDGGEDPEQADTDERHIEDSERDRFPNRYEMGE